MERDQPTRSEAGLSRRAFLRSAATAGAGLVAAPRIVRAGTLGVDTINLAVIGAGSQGWVLVNNCLKIGKGLRFVAVCDVWPRNRHIVAVRLGKYKRQDHPARGYEDYREMLAAEKDLDAVIVATPDWMHAEQTIACLDAGLHVYCEKEMSNDLAKARAMVLAARRTGRRLQIGHQRRSNPRYATALEYINGRKVCGRITCVSAQWNRGRYLTVGWKPRDALPPPVLAAYGYGTMDRLRNWRYYRAFSGGTIADLGSHQIDVLNWFLRGVPKAVMANGGAENYDRLEWYDSIVALYEWDYTFEGETRTVHGHYQACSTSGHGGYCETFMGPAGSLTISENNTVGCIRRESDAPLPAWEQKLAADTRGRPGAGVGRVAPGRCKCMIGPSIRAMAHRHYPPVAPPARPTTEHMPHLENFFAAVREPKVKLNCPPEAGYATCVSVLRANEAMAAGRKLPFKPEDFEA